MAYEFYVTIEAAKQGRLAGESAASRTRARSPGSASARGHAVARGRERAGRAASASTGRSRSRRSGAPRRRSCSAPSSATRDHERAVRVRAHERRRRRARLPHDQADRTRAVTSIHQYVATQDDAELDNAELEDVAITSAASRSRTSTARRRPPTARGQAVSDTAVDILLIGGGIASANAAAELREGGFAGSILVVTREMDAPYHRPPLTKGYLQGARTGLDAHPPRGVVRRARRASCARAPRSWTSTPRRKTAKLGREIVGFEQALLATGAASGACRSRAAMHNGIHCIRALGNADKLRTAAAPSTNVVVGGSYMACEVAASMALLGKSVHVGDAGGAPDGAPLRPRRGAVRGTTS